MSGKPARVRKKNTGLHNIAGKDDYLVKLSAKTKQSSPCAVCTLRMGRGFASHRKIGNLTIGRRGTHSPPSASAMLAGVLSRDTLFAENHFGVNRM